MKLVFVPTIAPDKQGDLLELTVLHGLRTILGKNCIDYPKKKVMYHDFSDTPKNTLHGKGFSLLTYPVLDISEADRQLIDVDAILYGDGHMYGENRLSEVVSTNVWVLDGHDLYGNAPRMITYENEMVIGAQFKKSFKRELVENIESVYPTGFGIPTHRIRPINLSTKSQLFQKTVPDAALFRQVNDVGGSTLHHKFTDEEEYYKDLQQSWFGLTCKKGGWDCLRHYEIIAAGTVLLFRDYNKKPILCSPQNLPCLSYSTPEELEAIVNRLLVDNKPTEEYFYYLTEQRKWLYNVGTTEARAIEIVKTIRTSIS